VSDVSQSGSIGWATSNEKREPSSNTNRTVANLLDGLIKASNRLCFRGISYRPYSMMCDLATVLAFGYALVFSAHFPSASPVGIFAAIVIALLAYKLVRELKAAFGKISARSFLQDCLLIIIPSPGSESQRPGVSNSTCRSSSSGNPIYNLMRPNLDPSALDQMHLLSLSNTLRGRSFHLGLLSVDQRTASARSIFRGTMRLHNCLRIRHFLLGRNLSPQSLNQLPPDA
jgi:hypothetical protein